MRQKQLNESINKTGSGKDPEKPSIPPSKRTVNENKQTSRRRNQYLKRQTKRRAKKILNKNHHNLKFKEVV